MEESILTSVKKLLNIAEDYTYFDTDIIIHINSALDIMQQLGVVKTANRVSDSDATWNDILGEFRLLQSAKTYVYYKVRLGFDPPTNSFLVDSMQKQITELEWRMNLEAESHE